jgi:hypothetical protein
MVFQGVEHCCGTSAFGVCIFLFHASNGFFDALGSDGRELLGSIRPSMLEVFVPDLCLVTRVNVEPMLEAAYVELEFSMLPDLVV